MVILPPVIKVLFDSLLHLNVDILAFVELLDKPEELGQIVAIIKTSIYRVCLV